MKTTPPVNAGKNWAEVDHSSYEGSTSLALRALALVFFKLPMAFSSCRERLRRIFGVPAKIHSTFGENAPNTEVTRSSGDEQLLS
jgi:hypothetical protein